MKKQDKSITTAQIKHIAELASIPITDQEEENLKNDFIEILKTVDVLQTVKIKNVDSTYQVTGFENVLRKDIVNQENMFSQEEALRNARNTHDGFFVVPRIIDEE